MSPDRLETEGQSIDSLRRAEDEFFVAYGTCLARFGREALSKSLLAYCGDRRRGGLCVSLLECRLDH